MRQFSARPVITAASTHLLLRTCGHTTHNSSQIRRLNECFSHTLTTSLNVQFGPSKGIINGFCVWAAPVHKPTLSRTQKTLNEKENACGSGSHWAVNELSPQGSFPPIPGIKRGGFPEKLNRVVTTWNKFNLTPFASRTRSQLEYTRDSDS